VSRLLDRRNGFCAEYMRRKVGKSVVAEVRAVGRRVRRLEAVTVFDNRQPQGVYVYRGGERFLIPFDADGWMLVSSPRETIDLDNQPWERKSALALDTGCVVRGECVEGIFCPTDCWGVWLVVDPETCEVTSTRYVPLYELSGSPLPGCGDTGPAPQTGNG